MFDFINMAGKPRGGKREGAGRKKGIASILAEKARDYIAERLDKELAPIVDRAIQDAKNGDKGARDWLTDRAHGRPTQPVELTGEDGDPLFVPTADDKKQADDALGEL